MATDPIRGLILSGGGARAAYQVGVLSAIADMLPTGTPNPFPVVCGTSAGAINAGALASNADNLRRAAQSMERMWANITAQQVYRTDMYAFLSSIIRWIFSGYAMGTTPEKSALLDNTPLRRLLTMVINFRNISANLNKGHLRALAITCSSYSNGESVSFFQSKDAFKGWARARRMGKPTEIGVQHLLASSAIPVLFPAERVGDSFYGDGALRQLAPLSAALHLGANQLLVIGVSGNEASAQPRENHNYPSMAQVLGHVLNSVFVDTLEGDVERLERINATVDALSDRQKRKNDINLRKVNVLKIYPSKPIDEIASEHIGELPWSLRFFLRGSGATRSTGASAVSYLLFEPGFTRTLLALGKKDANARRDEICAFFNDTCLQMPASANAD